MSQPGQLYLEDFSIGEVFTGRRRVVTHDDFQHFAALTGDAHPIHYDSDYASRTRFGKPVAHGLLVMAWSALGATELSQRLEASMIALVEQGCRFTAPVFVGDGITPSFVIESIDTPDGGRSGRIRMAVDMVKDDGTSCFKGFHTYQMQRRSPQSEQSA